MQSRIRKESDALDQAAGCLRQSWSQYPKFPHVREALVLLDPVRDKIKTQDLSKFVERYANLVREQAAARAKKLKKEAQLAADKIRWANQQAAARAAEEAHAASAQQDADSESNNEEEDGAGDAVAGKRKRTYNSDKNEASGSAGKVKDKAVKGLDRWRRTIVTAKRAGKTNPTTGYDPRHHVSRVQEKRPSPTKLNKVLGSDVLKKQSAGPSFKIPKKTHNYRAICPPPPASAPDCPSFVDEGLDSCVYDPLAEILGPGTQDKVKKKVSREVREDICRSPERPQNVHIHVQQIIDYLEEGEPDDGEKNPVSPEDILGPDKASPGLRLYSGQTDATTGFETNKDPAPEPDDDDPVEPEADQEDGGLEEEEPEPEPDQVDQGSRNGSMLVDHDELDYGDDNDGDEDDDEEEEDDDGNFKRGRKSATDVPAKQKQQSAIGIVGLLSSDPKKSATTPFSAPARPLPSSSSSSSSSSLSVGHAIRTPVVPLTGPSGRKQVIHDDVEPDVDADAKAKRAARFAETKQLYKTKSTTKITIPSDAPTATPAVVAAPPPVTPAAPVIRKGTASKLALLKDPPPRSFSPDPEVEPDINPVVRPKTRKPVQIVNPDALLDSEAGFDLFAPPEKVAATSPPPPVVSLDPAVPDNPAPLPHVVTPVNPLPPGDTPPAAAAVVPPVTRVDPRLAAASARRTDPRLAARKETESLFAPPVHAVTVPDPVPSAVLDLDHEIISESPAPISHPPPAVRQAAHDAPVVIESHILGTKPPLPPRPEESPFNELIVKNKVFIHLPAERSAICFRTCYDDAPPEDIPFTASPGLVIPDPRILIQSEKVDPRLQEDSDEEDVPIFGQQEADEPAAAETSATQRENGQATPPAPSDLFKVPVGLAPRSKKKTTTVTITKAKKRGTEKLNGVSVLSRMIEKPAALSRKGPQSLKAKPILLISEITFLRKCMKPKKLLWERLQEAKAREDDADSDVVMQSK